MEQITIKEIAKICGVGVSTVSRAINNHPDISIETKDMIMDVIHEYHYMPNNSARNLKRSENKAIAILVKGITNPFFSSMIKVMEEEIKRKKYTLVLQHIEPQEDEVNVAIQLVMEKRLSGIVFLGGLFEHSKDKLERLTVPFVLSTVGGLPENINKKSYSSFSVDNVLESFRAVDYLCKLGHRKIAIITALPSDQSIGRLRLEGYYRALDHHNIPRNERLVGYMKENIQEYSYHNGYMVTKELLNRKEEFTAIFAISDILAIGACKAILDEGKRIPEDYSIMGFDGVEISQFYTPRITTIKQPIEEIALETIQTLFDVIKNREKNQHIIFPGELLKGESTRKVLEENIF